MAHTEDHIDCPDCLKKAYIATSRLDPSLTYAVAGTKWIESRRFERPQAASTKPAVDVGAKRPRFVSDRSLEDFEQYHRALMRFFAKMPLHKIHLGNIRSYQEQRAAGLLGPKREELFIKFGKPLARKMKVSLEDVAANPEMRALVDARIDAQLPREVNGNKINQELGMLIRVLKRAGLWTKDFAEGYEALQHQESDIPRALNPEEQQHFLDTGIATEDGYIGQYSIVGIHCTLSTIEQRKIRLGDINLVQDVVLIRAASSKNKYRTRTIPLTELAHWAFERLIERANLLGSVQPQHYLFPFRVKPEKFDPTRPMTVSGIKKPWDTVRCAAGVPWFTPYMLRHTGCTRYAEDGVSIHVLLAMAGHMSRKMQQHYVHISDAAKRRTVERTYGGYPHPKAPAKAAEASKAKVAAMPARSL